MHSHHSDNFSLITRWERHRKNYRYNCCIQYFLLRDRMPPISWRRTGRLVLSSNHRSRALWTSRSLGTPILPMPFPHNPQLIKHPPRPRGQQLHRTSSAFTTLFNQLHIFQMILVFNLHLGHLFSKGFAFHRHLLHPIFFIIWK